MTHATDSQHAVSRRHAARRIALAYVAVALLWIFCSDFLSTLLATDGGVLAQIQVFKGAGFVLTTGAMLYLAIRRYESAHVRYEQALARSEAKYRRLVDTMPDGLLVLDGQRRIVYVNDRLCELWGLPRDCAIGQSPAEFVAAECQEALGQGMAALDNGHQRPMEIGWSGGGERRVDTLVSFRSLQDEEGRAGGFAVVTDISDIKAAQQALRESEENHRRLARSRQLLLRELDHRVKNNLGELYSLVQIYQSRANGVGHFSQLIRDKLMAMKKVHEMISAGGWGLVRLDELVGTVAGLKSDGAMRYDALRMEAMDVSVSAGTANAMAMVLQELLTNAHKHGSLSVPEGIVEVSARRLGEGRIELTWRESGGPAPASGSPRGVGLDLIDGLCRFDLAGECQVDFAPEGLRCVIRFRNEPTSSPPVDVEG